MLKIRCGCAGRMLSKQPVPSEKKRAAASRGGVVQGGEGEGEESLEKWWALSHMLIMLSSKLVGGTSWRWRS